MGERKGTNLYYPPDYDPKKGGLNKFLGTHALRERARKLHMGILIIRFEMPFNIWCDGCGNHIGMGVRYNAEKQKVGEYITTPIWKFKMKCHLCSNFIEIVTEPRSSDYVIVGGARRQENRWDPCENEQVVLEDKNKSKRLFDDAMYKMEHVHGDKKLADSIQPMLSKLAEKRQKLWHDDYAANSALRQQFREKSRELKVKDGTFSNANLEIKLLPHSKEDALKAAQICQSATQDSAKRERSNKQELFSQGISLSCFHKNRWQSDVGKTFPDRHFKRNAILNGVQRKSQNCKNVSYKNHTLRKNVKIERLQDRTPKNCVTLSDVERKSPDYHVTNCETCTNENDSSAQNPTIDLKTVTTENFETSYKISNSKPTDYVVKLNNATSCSKMHSSASSMISSCKTSEVQTCSKNFSLVSHDYDDISSDESIL